MDDFIEFMKLVAKSPPQLSIALIGVAIRDAWMQIALAGVLVSGSAVIWRRWRKRRQGMEWHELLAEPVPMPEPHKASDEPHTIDCKCTMGLVAAPEDDGFYVWYENRTNASHIILPEKQARRLYAAYLHNKDIIDQQVESEVVE